MCTRLNAIGFACEMDRATAEHLRDIAVRRARRIEAGQGEYRVWRAAEGGEIWLHYHPGQAQRRPTSGFEPIDNLVAMSVTHAGTSRITMEIQIVDRKVRNPLDAMILAEPIAAAGAAVPLIGFEVVGYATVAKPLSKRCDVQLCGLAHRLWAYDSPRMFLDMVPPHRLTNLGAIAPVDARHIVDAEQTYKTRPGTVALVTGTVERSLRLVNRLTGAPYYWLSVKSEWGLVDVCANPQRIWGDVSIGNVVQAMVSMSGRLLEAG